MDIFKIAIIGICIASVALTIKNVKPEMALLVSIAAAILILLLTITPLSQIAGFISTITSAMPISHEIFSVLFKAVGIGIVSQLASEICFDAGERAIASKILLAGRISILAVSIPLYVEILKIISGLLKG